MVGTHVLAHLLAELAATDDDGPLVPPGPQQGDRLAHSVIGAGQQAGETHEVGLHLSGLLGKDSG
jgi:hypothetical protein